MSVPDTPKNTPNRLAPGADSAWAWWACCLALVILFLAFGLAYSYGVFLQAITAEFEIGHAAAAGLFSVTSLLVFGSGVVTGPLADRFGPRPLIIASGLAIGGGLWYAAAATALWQAYLGYGLGLGLGAGCVYVPVVAAIGRWFSRYRGAALGIAVCGIGLGTLVFAPLSERLISALGWRATYTVYAGIAALGLGGAGFLFPSPPAAGEQPNVRTTERRRLFARLYGATLVLNLVLYVPLVLLPSAAAASGVSRLVAAGLVATIGIASVAGRLLIGFAGQRYATLALYRACFALIAGSFVVWLFADHYTTFAVFAVILGLGYGGYIALTPTVLAEIFGLAGLGRRLGVLYTAVALGAGCGPWLAGLLVDRTDGYVIPVMAFIAIGFAAFLMITRVETEKTGPGRS